MNPTIQKLLLFLAMAMMATATHPVIYPTTAAATVTVTETEQACMTGEPGTNLTPLAIASALATAADVTAAASLAASLMAENQYGRSSADNNIDPTVIPQTRTVTTFASATNCPPAPTFSIDEGEFGRLYNDELGRLAALTTTNVTVETDKRWSKGRRSLCFTGSDWMLAGRYGLWLDGWGQEPDGCGKGVLDNLRGHCGPIAYWECMYWGSGVVLTFWALMPRYSGCVVDAMWQASPAAQREEDLCCAYVGAGVIHTGRHMC